MLPGGRRSGSAVGSREYGLAHWFQQAMPHPAVGPVVGLDQ